jgi:hypothetical protein
MAVSSNVTLLEDMDSVVAGQITDISGGQGAGANQDIFIEGNESVGRRTDGATNKGFIIDSTVTTDLSGTEEHVGFWLWITQWAQVTNIAALIGSSGADYDQHNVPAAQYPDLGGFIRVWVSVARTPDATGGAGLTASAATDYGTICSIGNVGGSAQNQVLDAVHSSTNTEGLTWDGTGGDFDAFSTFESTNRTGVVVESNGIIFALARLNLGSATATTFTDSAFVVVFPDNDLCTSTFMGVTVDLQNASTAITLTNGSFQAADINSTNKGDFLVTGSSGALSWSGASLVGLRIINLTTGVALTNGSVVSCGQIDAAGATLVGTSVSNYTGATGTAALLWDVATDTDTYLDDMSFDKGSGTVHAIELGTNCPATITFRGHDYGSGYNASNQQNDSTIYNNSGKTITINVSGGDTPSYRDGAGATTIVQNTVTVSCTVVDVDGVAVQGARVRFEESVGGTLVNQGTTDATGLFTFSYNYSADTDVDVVVRLKGYLPQRIAATIVNTGLTVPVTFIRDNIVNLP